MSKLIDRNRLHVLLNRVASGEANVEFAYGVIIEEFDHLKACMDVSSRVNELASGILFDHIDRLRDPCPDSDPLERIAADISQAFSDAKLVSLLRDRTATPRGVELMIKG